MRHRRPGTSEPGGIAGPLTTGLLLLALSFPAFAEAPPPDKTSLDLHAALELSVKGSTMSADEAIDLEKGLVDEPDNLAARVRLLGYYAPYRPDTRRSWEEHLVWLLEKHPGDPGVSEITRQVRAVPFAEASELAKRLWLQQAKEHSEDPRVQANASRYFFSLDDRELAQQLLENARKLEPDNPRWSVDLARLTLLQTGEERVAAARGSLAELEAVLAKMTPDERVAQLPTAARLALDSGNLDKARDYASEALEHAKDEDQWQRGNLLHHGHLALGRVALRRGDLDAAKRHLLEAGRTPGSPLLATFGPNMKLAEELLIEGHDETVLTFLELCADFWPRGTDQLEKWRRDVESEQLPDFGPNLYF